MAFTRFVDADFISHAHYDFWVFQRRFTLNLSQKNEECPN